MQTTATTPQRRPRRNTKSQKAKDPSSSTNTPKGFQAVITQDSALDQPTSNLSQQLARSSTMALNPSDIEHTLATPQRPKSMYDPPSIHEALPKGLQSGNVSAIDSDGQRGKKAQKSQKRQSGSAFINSNLNCTPQRKESQTPAKTPTQAYAGPTFHASPAPSSLPMPKFFSKSVPEVDKTKGLTARMEQEASEEAISPEGSEGSPTREKAERVQQLTKEESPLDIFFRADREEKARARQASSSSPLHNVVPSIQEPRAVDHPPVFPSPSLDHVRHHSRHPTNGSSNGLFPMELGDEGSNSPAHPVERPSIPTAPSRANSAPSITSNQAEQDEVARRLATSLALKKLLLTPQLEQPKSSVTGSPSEGKRRRTPPVKESSGPFASSPSPGPKVQILSRNKPASLPQLQKQFGSAAASDGSPRPASSNLRQELSAPQTPDQSNLPELPAITTPFRERISPAAPPPSRSQQNAVHGAAFSPTGPKVLSGVASPTISKPNDVSLLENELRRVLKLGSGGATGVQS